MLQISTKDSLAHLLTVPYLNCFACRFSFGYCSLQHSNLLETAKTLPRLPECQSVPKIVGTDFFFGYDMKAGISLFWLCLVLKNSFSYSFITKKTLYLLKNTALDFEEKRILSLDSYMDSDINHYNFIPLVENSYFYLSTKDMSNISCLSSLGEFQHFESVLRIIDFQSLEKYEKVDNHSTISYIKECYNLLLLLPFKTTFKMPSVAKQANIINHPYLFTMEHNENNLLNLHEVQTYSNQSILIATMNLNDANITHVNKSPYDRRQNFNKASIRLSSFVSKTSDDPDSQKGYDLMEMFKENFNFLINKVAHSKVGEMLENKSWTGMMGGVLDNEIDFGKSTCYLDNNVPQEAQMGCQP